MQSYLIRSFLVLIFSGVVIFCYYFLFPFHSYDPGIFPLYMGIILFLFACYKWYYLSLGYSKIEFSLFKILWYGALHLLVLSFLFFYSTWEAGIHCLFLFWKIVFFFALVSILFLVLLSFGQKLLSISLEKYSEHNPYVLILLSGALGFVVYIFSLTILAISGLYTMESVLLVVSWIAIVSYREIQKNISVFLWASISFENHDFESHDMISRIRPYLLSSELLFIVVTGIISVSLISIVRPFPIGWDDLGVYMNYPKLLSAAWGNLPLGTMYPWQLFTGIWFLFKSQNFAFFLNSLSVVLSFFVLYFWLKSLLPKAQKTFINLPLLMGTVFISLPMVVFQVAKDMKLDIGLFALSFSAVIVLYYLYMNYEAITKRDRNIFLFIIGAVVGTCFGIKVTSLLLISAIIGGIFYKFFRIWGYIGYIFFYISIFTSLGLWGLMNVVYPSDNQLLIQVFSGISALLGIGFIVAGGYRQKGIPMKEFLSTLCIFVLGIWVVLVPWQVKHIWEIGSDSVTISRLLWGNSNRFVPDYTEIYSESELSERNSLYAWERITESGDVQNEDFGRYFWYEEGINNYLKLPWNLTMQVNQKGEFTDIWFLFFALLPGVFLFLPYRRPVYMIPVIGVLIFELLYFLPTGISELLTSVFSLISLPLWYAFILVPFIASVIFFYYTLDRSQRVSQIFLLNYVLSVFYVFLWTISAFGIVWYGIVMYGMSLVMIYLCLYQLSSYNSNQELQQKASWFLWVCFIFFVYFIHSVIPYYLNNLEKAGFWEYKKGSVTQNTALFQSHPEYIDILFDLNLSEQARQQYLADYKQQALEIFQQVWSASEAQKILGNTSEVSVIHGILGSITNLTDNQNTIKAKSSAVSLREQIYQDILFPVQENASDAVIYRIGTFLKYYIHSNHSRILEDSLVTTFDTYYYDDNYDLIYERMKKTGIEYLLVDLNAATIDDDPRKDLTRRYENLVKSFTSNKLELIETDSICLQVWLEKYRETGDIQKFTRLATVNHFSNSLSQSDKLIECHREVLSILTTQKVSIDNYPYLLGISQYILRQWDVEKQPEAIVQIIQSLVRQWSKVLLKIQ